MIVGCPKEIKNHECRIGLTPANVREYVDHGHRVLIQAGAGVNAGFPDIAAIVPAQELQPPIISNMFQQQVCFSNVVELSGKPSRKLLLLKGHPCRN